MRDSSCVLCEHFKWIAQVCLAVEPPELLFQCCNLPWTAPVLERARNTRLNASNTFQKGTPIGKKRFKLQGQGAEQTGSNSGQKEDGVSG